MFLAATALVGFNWFLAKAVFNSGFTLLRWTFSGSFLALQAGILLLLATGALGTVGQIFMTNAYRHASAAAAVCMTPEAANASPKGRPCFFAAASRSCRNSVA